MKSRNKRHGFYGEVSRAFGEVVADAVWRSTYELVLDFLDGNDRRTLAREYLDGKPGRYFADFCRNKGWSVTIAEARDYIARDGESFDVIASECGLQSYAYAER